MNNINSIGPVGGPERIKKTAKSQKPSPNEGVNFKDTLAGFMRDVNDMQIKADKSIEKMVSGEVNDVHQVMNTVQEANVAFNMMMEIRNKVMDAYKEVMRMRL